MLELIIEGQEVWNEGANGGAGAFETIPPTILAFEHSLLSLSKWEQFYEKPFLGERPKTEEETFRYILFMCTTPDASFSAFERLTNEDYKKIQNYIAKKMTATTFHSLTDGRAGRKEVITADLIRYWMISLQIPVEYETRHLSELFTLIKVFDAKNSKQKKKSPTQVMNEQRELNAQRRAALGTTG